MSNPEFNKVRREVATTMLDGIAHIAGLNIEPLSQKASMLWSLIASRTVPIIIIEPEMGPRNWGVDFRIVVERGNQGRFEDSCGAVVIDPVRFGSLSPRVQRSELVRTVAVAGQFPSVEPLRTTYEKALSLQVDFLGAEPGVLLDPRTTDHDTLIRQILDPEMYFGDFGRDHWQASLRRIREEGRMPVHGLSDGEQDRLYDFLLTRIDAFLAARTLCAALNSNPNEETMRRFKRAKFEDLAMRNADFAARFALARRDPPTLPT